MMHDPAPDDLKFFAEHLRAQPPGMLPEHWREEILVAALRTASPSLLLSRWQRAVGMLGRWFWPHPVAYAGLAAVWILIVAMRLSTPAFEPDPVFPRSDASFAGSAALDGGVPIFESMRLAEQESFLLSYTENRP